MPNYYCVTKNPIARAGIIRKLLAKGYSLYGNLSVSDYFSRWPAAQWPVVVVRFDAEFARKPTIDLQMLRTIDAIKVSPVTLKGIPILNLSSPVFPAAAKYSITYQKADGSVGNYTISNPIEMGEDRFTSYAFGKGVKTFIKERVRRFEQVA